MKSEKHNGYANYPTWLLAAEIDNKESLYNNFRSFIKKSMESEEPPSYSGVKSVLMHMLQEYAEKVEPRKNNSFWDSIINDVAKEQICYREIAEIMLKEEGYPKH